jgi:hypothetical protein
MLIPMPSPTGRNRAGLFIRGPVARALAAAYDAKGGLMAYGSRRPARDQDPPPPDDSGSMHGQDPDDGLDQIKTFLRNRLDPQDFARLEAMLQALNGGGEEPEGQDEPEPFRGRPSGGRVNWNEDAESALLPNGPGYQNIPEENRAEFRDRDRRPAMDSRGGGGYFANFPSNAKVTFGYGS